MSKNYEKYKKYYETGMWNKKMLHDVTNKGKLTAEEYEKITGEAYQDD